MKLTADSATDLTLFIRALNKASVESGVHIFSDAVLSVHEDDTCVRIFWDEEARMYVIEDIR